MPAPATLRPPSAPKTAACKGMAGGKGAGEAAALASLLRPRLSAALGSATGSEKMPCRSNTWTALDDPASEAATSARTAEGLFRCPASRAAAISAKALLEVPSFPLPLPPRPVAATARGVKLAGAGPHSSKGEALCSSNACTIVQEAPTREAQSRGVNPRLSLHCTWLRIERSCSTAASWHLRTARLRGVAPSRGWRLFKMDSMAVLLSFSRYDCKKLAKPKLAAH
mmetsp:Transcript_33650/g.78650  ORF Transcript_33650/g.78650 Transcript_33650/m.78650 type:complete len:226 (-) Transcript_33650:218-895(-)